MSIKFMEPGTDATGDFLFWPTVFTSGAASVTSDTAVKNTGQRSIKCVCGAGEFSLIKTGDGVLADAGRRVSFWIYMPSWPASTSAIPMVARTVGNDYVFFLLVRSDGNLDLGSGSGPYVQGVTISIGVWHHVAVSYVISSTTNFTIRVWLDGVLVAQATQADGTLERTSTSGLELGCANAIAHEVQIDDVYIDDLTDLSFPGAIHVTAKKPAANNTNNFDTAIGANPTIRSANVSEVPASDVNGWRHAATSDVQENYRLQSAADGDVNVASEQIIGRCAWIKAAGAAGGAGTPEIMDDGTESAIVLTASPKLFTVLTDTADYPTNNAAIGMRSTNNADDTFLYECGQLIAYRLEPKASRFAITQRTL